MKVSEWLSENVDSHGIYSVDLLAELPDPVSYDATTDRLVTKAGASRRLRSQSADAMEESQGAERTRNPKGAYLDPGIPATTRLVGGYSLSMALDLLLTGEDGGATLMGRGFRHRASIAHLEASGF